MDLPSMTKASIIETVVNELHLCERYFSQGWKFFQHSGVNIHPRFVLHLRRIGDLLLYLNDQEQQNVQRRLQKAIMKYVPIDTRCHPLLIFENGVYTLQVFQEYEESKDSLSDLDPYWVTDDIISMYV